MAALIAGIACLGGIFFVPAWDRMLLSSAAYWGRPVDLKLEKLIYYREGVDATVAVTELRSGDPRLANLASRQLRINGKVDASNSLMDGFTHVGFPHLAIMSAPSVEKMLIVGLGSGISVGSAATHSEIERIDCVEISDAVVEAARMAFDDYDYRALDDPRVRLIRADGRNHLLLTKERYDVILSIPSNPWMAGVSNLFTREYFELCRDRLTESGRLCVWLQAYSITIEDFRAVIRTLASVFPNVTMWQGATTDLMLIAAPAPYEISADRVLSSFAEPAVEADLARIGYQAPHVLLSTLVAGGPSLVEWAGDGIVHTDDNAHLEYSAPLALYAAQSETDQIIKALIDHGALPVESVVAVDPSDPAQTALVAAAARGQQSLRLRINAYHQSWTGRYAEAVESMFKSYLDYPDHVLSLCTLKTDFLPLAVQLARQPGQRELANVQPPIIAAVRNAPLPAPVLPKTEPMNR
jgi:spermidine synthase